MNIRSSSSVELCPFWNFKSWKYKVFRTFILHALIYWAEILHKSLLYCTTDQVRVSSIYVNGLRSYVPFGTFNPGNTVFRTFSYMLWHIELKFYIWLCYIVLQIKFECRQFPSIFVGVMLLLELIILELHNFPHFCLHALKYWAEILHMSQCMTKGVFWHRKSIIYIFYWI